MGQKVNPTGFRLGFNKNWTSHWFAGKNLVASLQEDHSIKTVIFEKYKRSGISSIETFRNRGDVVVNIHTAKPGIIIGRSGKGAQELKAKLELTIARLRKTNDKVGLRLNIVETKIPEFSAQVVADTIAGQLERRISVKRAMRQAIERTMERRAKGIKIKVSGRLNGAEIARDEVMSNGSIPLQTIRSDISYAQATAVTTYGAIGIKVWIYLGQSDTMPSAQPVEQPSRYNNNRG
ncbi:MAG TPA: 30S ribosomal protein S3 [Verrucomicrobiae bacterium]|nr:30S ribosomal protein S3 [Verrucomicrobiae bacterium]